MIPPPAKALAGECPRTSTIPVVSLDVDVLTDTVASRLATSLLGHVLYLKNQIPLPIVQLARMTNRKGNTKAAKMKADLLSSFDTLASHLVTTFSALSTALAQAKASSSSDDDDVNVSRAYMAILVGPSLGTARSKVIYGVDNFVAHVWGIRDEDDEVDEESSGEECPEDSEDGEDDEDGESSESASSEGEESEGNTPVDGGGEKAESFQDEEEAKDGVEEGEEAPKRQENEHDYPPPPPHRHQSYAEEQRFLHAADRLLARVLASADTEGHGISNEMSPSQIHILLRAPRRFVHPVWVPRQNIQKQMEATLSDFLNQSWPSQGNDELSPKKKKKKPVEGVWVTAKNGLRGPPVPLNEKLNVPEEDEMIWWSWDGKLVGFTDW